MRGTGKNITQSEREKKLQEGIEQGIKSISISYTEARALYNTTHTRQDVFDIPARFYYQEELYYLRNIDGCYAKVVDMEMLQQECLLKDGDAWSPTVQKPVPNLQAENLRAKARYCLQFYPEHWNEKADIVWNEEKKTVNLKRLLTYTVEFYYNTPVIHEKMTVVVDKVYRAISSVGDPCDYE